MRPTNDRHTLSDQRREGDDAGQTLIEFAIVVFVFMLIIVGIVDLSRAVYARNVVTSAAREAARFGSTDPDNAPQIEATARKVAIAAGLDDGELRVSVSRPDAVNVQVVVTYTFRPVTALVGSHLSGGSGGGIVLRGCSLMRAE